MPKALHDKLAREAKKKGLTGKRKAAYIYGTMSKIESRKKAKKKHSKKVVKKKVHKKRGK
ncbi:MAG: hypothetical protein GWP19_00175 [Planctomycetia bacterium]|nr:hypothetical protein [Planctomycetia bacterium]